MIALPIVALLTAGVGLGLLLGLRYLRGLPRKPVMIGAHLLLGAGTLEQIAVLLHGTPSGDVIADQMLGRVALVLIAGALLFGLCAPLLSRQSRRGAEALLVGHASLGALGFAALIAWTFSL